ncbi:hypothetical protein BS47DRAFT_1400646 [Hydnum rufescens UP504]|uniref:Uncharacterized protein n=1 Tax=Hydnum rufescens UP504 TaxID=1448309 RepID=A0A9P6DND4_9AGAM|nr:hypothetical protein BS47DRAFT_1400646 [Hydnum rufescens UP504]
MNKHSTQSACSVTPLLVALSPGIVIIKSVDRHSTQSACPRLTRSSSTATVRVIAREGTFYPVSTWFDITDYCPCIGSTVLAGITLIILIKSMNKHSTQSACSMFRRFMQVMLDYLPGSYYWVAINSSIEFAYDCPTKPTSTTAHSPCLPNPPMSTFRLMRATHNPLISVNVPPAGYKPIPPHQHLPHT